MHPMPHFLLISPVKSGSRQASFTGGRENFSCLSVSFSTHFSIDLPTEKLMRKWTHSLLYGSEMLKWWSVLRKPTLVLRTREMSVCLRHSPTPSLLYFLYQRLCPFLTACTETGSYLLGNTPLKVIKTLGALGGEAYGTPVTDNAVMISCTKSSFPTPVRVGDENVLL